MKILPIIAAATFALAPMAAQAKCTDTPIISSFQEQEDGTNCPATSFEKGVGQILFGAVAFLIGAEVISGGEVFPLNKGVFSGVGGAVAVGG